MLTIKQALTKIGGGTLILPAIQRKFVWDMSQICKLFDSMMRGYPINTFMLWQVENRDAIPNLKFYSILDNYCERINEDNPEKVDLVFPFMAIIDGQQRMTAIKIGIRGTYSVKKRYARWPSTHDESVLPKRKLYLELTTKLDEEADDNDERLVYNFKFLTNDEYGEANNGDKYWFPIGDIEIIGGEKDRQEPPDQASASSKINKYITDNNIPHPDTAYELLLGLYNLVYLDQVIKYHLETTQESKRVLDIFIRTNSGGTQLSYSDLLMSFAVHHWKNDAKEKIDQLVRNIRLSKDMGFSVDRDYVLKASLLLTGHQVKFSLSALNRDVVKDIETHWDDISGSLIAALKLVRGFGLDDASLKSKNATIPIAYYLFKRKFSNTKLYKKIITKAPNSLILSEVRLMKKWLMLSLVNRVFGGQSDGILSKLRTILDDNSEAVSFPLESILNGFRGSTKSLFMSEDEIELLLKTQKDDYLCYTILALISPELDDSYSIDIDHLHPASSFKNKGKLKALLEDDFNLIDQEFFLKQENWNSLPNLMLRVRASNQSKNDTALDKWYSDSNEADKALALIPPDSNLMLSSFQDLFNARKQLMKERLINLGLIADDQEDDTELSL